MIVSPKYGLWMAKVVIEAENEKGKLKKIQEIHLLDAVNPGDAEKQVAEIMDGTIFDWKIKSISSFPCNAISLPDKKEKNN